MNLKAVFGSIAQTAASALGSVAQTQTPTAAPLTNGAGQATQTQADEALRQMMSKQAKPSLFEEQVKQISPDVLARRNVFDKPVTVVLAKPAEQMTKPEYDQAFARAVLKRAGMTDATDAEVAKFMNDYARVTGGRFGFIADEQELRALHAKQGGEMRATTSDYGLAVADAGMRQIHADRAEMRAKVEQLRHESQQYGEEALAGFYKLQANGAINVVNDATKIIGIPELPKFEAGGEYWADKKQVGEAAATIGAAVVTGGASLPSDLLLIGSSTGNMAEAVKGEDFRTGEQLSTTERVIRGAGGVAGAYSVRGTVGDITEAVSSQVKNIKPPANVAEAVTAEGVRVPVAADDVLATTQMEARAVKETGGRRNVEAHEAAGGHTLEKHVNKSDVELRERLVNKPKAKVKDASSFYSEAIANRVQMEFVKQHKQEITAWLKSGSFRYRGYVEMSEPIGKVVGRAKNSAAAESSKAFVVLVRDKSPQGYYVRTAFPVR